MAKQSNQPDISPSAPAESSSGMDDLIDLHRGEGYPLDGADEITRRSLTNVILFAGTAESGKTTLLASLYLMFQKDRKQPFGGYSFAGSRTLVGFEKRVHLARVTSGLDKPKTERSTVSELLHLRVRKHDRSSPSKDLLLCDLWGEDFREARDSVDGCRRLGIVRRADAFVLLVDGAKLAKFDARQQAKVDPLMLLRNTLDCDMLAEEAHVDVLFTKWDILGQSPDREDTEKFATHIQDEVKRRFAHRVGSLAFWQVAAHATEGNVPIAHGLEDLFRTWVERNTGMARRRPCSAPEPVEACEYDRYALRSLEAISLSETRETP